MTAILFAFSFICYNLYSLSAFIACTSACGAEQTTGTNIIQTEHNIVKNPNWTEANQLAIYKRGRGFELGTTEKQIQVVVRAGLECLDWFRPRLHYAGEF